MDDSVDLDLNEINKIVDIKREQKEDIDTSRDHSNNNSFFVKAMKTWGNEELDDDATFKKKLNQLKRVSKTNKGTNDNNGPRSKFCQQKKENVVFSPEIFLKSFEPKVTNSKLNDQQNNNFNNFKKNNKKRNNNKRNSIMSAASKNTTASSVTATPNVKATPLNHQKIKLLDELNHQKYSYESKRHGENILQKFSCEGFYPKHLLTPQLNSNRCINYEGLMAQKSTTNIPHVFNGFNTEYGLEAKEDLQRRMSLQITSPPYVYNPMDCLIDNTIPIKSKREHLDDVHNRINLEKIIRGLDARTTLMIRHIPNKYNIKTFLEDIDIKFKNKYDLVYLPLDYNNNCNLGFAFINFVEAKHIPYFYFLFRGKKWRRFNSEKICELAYAKFQGKKELIAHFEKGSIMQFEAEEKKPVILPTPEILPKVELPLKYFEAFINLYPFASYEVNSVSQDFIVHSFGSSN